MPAPLDADLRLRVVQTYEGGDATVEEVAERFCVGPASSTSTSTSTSSSSSSSSSTSSSVSVSVSVSVSASGSTPARGAVSGPPPTGPREPDEAAILAKYHRLASEATQAVSM